MGPTISPSTTDFKNTRKKSEVPATRTVFEYFTSVTHPLSMRESMRLRESNMHEESSDNDIPNSQHSMEKQKSLLKGDELVHCMIHEPQQQKKKNADKNTKQT